MSWYKSSQLEQINKEIEVLKIRGHRLDMWLKNLKEKGDAENISFVRKLLIQMKNDYDELKNQRKKLTEDTKITPFARSLPYM